MEEIRLNMCVYICMIMQRKTKLQLTAAQTATMEGSKSGGMVSERTCCNKI